MPKSSLDIIQKRLEAKKVNDYEIFLIERDIFETIFLKNNIDNERETAHSEYYLRILHQNSNETGIGVTKANSLNTQDIDNTIETCLNLSKINISPKYDFPKEKKIPKINTADKSILNDPVGIKKELSQELIYLISEQNEVTPTFGRFRIHSHNSFIRNSNGLDLESKKTFFFVEFSLKAEKDGRLAEYWTVDYYKERDHLNFENRIKKWVNYAKNNLSAELPKPNSNAIVIFPPHVLRAAINPVIGGHSLAKSHYEKTSAFEIDSQVASNLFSLIDDGLLEGGLNSSPWDREGNPRQKTEVISKGIFKNRLYDEKYAILENESSTGNSVMGLGGSSSNGISNLVINPGEISLNEMISNIKEGYLIEKFSWLNPDSISGYFGAEIRGGYYIRNGEYKHPIKLGNVSGNILQMIKNILYISEEREFVENALFPYIAFTGLEISS
ncbi:MAG: metallopeptidase TldD-related protein [Candidatus Thorarchaeota archaeon]